MRCLVPWMLLALVILPACGDGAAPTAQSTQQGEQAPEARTLAALLDSPPRLPRALRELAARAWHTRWSGAISADTLALEIDRLRERGGLASSEELAAWRADVLLQSSGTRGLAAATAPQRMATRSLLRRARGDLETLRSEQMPLALVLVLAQKLNWSLDPVTGRAQDTQALEQVLEDLFAGVESGPGDLLTSKDRIAAYRAADKTYRDRIRAYERLWKKGRPSKPSDHTPGIQEAKEVLDQCERAFSTSWREWLAGRGIDWDAQAGRAAPSKLDPGLIRDLGDRAMRMADIQALFEQLVKGESHPAARLAALSKRSEPLARAVGIYEEGMRTGDGFEHAGLAVALRLATRGLEALRGRIRAFELAQRAGAPLPADLQSANSWEGVAREVGAAPTDGSGHLGAAPIGQDGIVALRRAFAASPEERGTLLEQLMQSQRALESALAQAAAAGGAAAQIMERTAAQDLEDVQGVLASDDHERTRAVRMEIAQELLYGDGNVATRMEEIEKGASLYSSFSSEGRTDLLTSLRRHDRRDVEEGAPGADARDEAAPKREQRIAGAISKGEEAVGAARNVTNMLVTLDLVSVEDANEVLRGLDAANAGFTIAAGLATGNVFDVISGTANLVAILSGKPAPPDPAQVRHEQVMEALSVLADGQVRILEALAGIIEQLDGIRMQLGELERIMISTHQLIVDDQLQGLRFARDFIQGLSYYGGDDTRAGGMPLHRLQDYEQLRAHFEKHRDAYVQGRRFLADHVRGQPLEIQRLAERFEEAGDMPRLLGQLNGWDGVRQNEERIKRTFRLLDTVLLPEARERVFGSLTEPVQDHAALLRKLEILTDAGHARAQVWARKNRELSLENNLRIYENPIVAGDIARGVAAFHLHGLVDLGKDFSGSLPTLEQLTAPGFDPSFGFGSTPEARREQILASLDKAQALLERVRAQGALAQGDILAPVLALLALSDTWHCDHPIRAEAAWLLSKDPVLRHNAARFWLMVHRGTTRAEQDAVYAKILALLAPAVRATCWQGPAFPLRAPMSYGELVAAPLPPMPYGLLLLAHRFTEPMISPSWLLGRLPNAGDPVRKAPLHTYDLRLTAPFEADPKGQMIMRSAPSFFGSPAEGYWWNDIRRAEAKEIIEANQEIEKRMGKTHDPKQRARLAKGRMPVTLWCDPVRLPSARDADAGRYLTLETMNLLDEAASWVETSRRETAAVYPSGDPLDERLLRALWVESLQAAWTR